MAETEALQSYIREHKIEELVMGLVEGLLRSRPQKRPKEFWVEMLSKELKGDDGGGSPSRAPAPAPGSNQGSEVPGHLLVRLFEATRNITSEIVPREAIGTIIRETINMLDCDRASLFVFDKRIDMLVLNASNLKHPIRVKPGQGITGHVFTTQDTVNIPDCYKDSRFDQGFDKQTGYTTRNMLTMPIIDFENEVMGVLQAINKNDGHFTRVDEIMLGHLTQHVGIALRNAEVYRDAIVTSERANALLHMIQSLSQDLGVQSTILTITMHANELVQADRCTVFLVDEAKQQLWSVATDSGKEIRIPKSAGIAGECATEAKLIAIPDAYADPRFNTKVDKATGYHTQSILAVPVCGRWRGGDKNPVLAVIQMINKMEFDGEVGKFDEEDVQVMETFSTFVGSKLEGSALLAGKAKSAKDEGAEAFGSSQSSAGFGSGGGHGHKAADEGVHVSHGNTILEEGSDEEDEG